MPPPTKKCCVDTTPAPLPQAPLGSPGSPGACMYRHIFANVCASPTTSRLSHSSRVSTALAGSLLLRNPLLLRTAITGLSAPAAAGQGLPPTGCGQQQQEQPARSCSSRTSRPPSTMVSHTLPMRATAFRSSSTTQVCRSVSQAGSSCRVTLPSTHGQSQPASHRGSFTLTHMHAVSPGLLHTLCRCQGACGPLVGG